MIVNARITGWSARTGSTSAGVAAYGADALAGPVACCRQGITAGQVRLLETADLTADETVIFRADRTGVPAIATGDRVQLDGSAVWHEVAKAVSTTKGPLTAVQLFVRRLR